MRRTLKCLGGIFVFVFIIGSACVGPRTIPPRPSQSEYLSVDYRRFASGLYVDELANKYVKLDCQFFAIRSDLPKGYSSAKYMSFQVYQQTGLHIEAPLIVVIPKDQADFVFSLRQGDRLKLYGLSVPRVFQDRFKGGFYKELFIETDLIEKQ